MAKKKTTAPVKPTKVEAEPVAEVKPLTRVDGLLAELSKLYHEDPAAFAELVTRARSLGLFPAWTRG